MKVWISFGLFGLYIGTLCGLSSSPIAVALMPLFFSFAGGSVLIFFGKMPSVSRESAVAAIGAISFGALLGTIAAIYVSTHSLLGPKPRLEEGGYLRSQVATNLEATLMLLEQGFLKPQEAASRIREELKSVTRAR